MLTDVELDKNLIVRHGDGQYYRTKIIASVQDLHWEE